MGLLIVKSQTLPEKRIAQETGKRWVMELTEEMYEKHSSIGFNSEYCPQVFFDKNYQSEYKNSLYRYVRYIIPYDFDYGKIPGLSAESRMKLENVRPLTLGQASRISGIRTSDVMLLMVYLR